MYSHLALGRLGPSEHGLPLLLRGLRMEEARELLSIQSLQPARARSHPPTLPAV
jgi:hypothetical protein